MFLRHGYNPEVLRNMFLEMMTTHHWFDDPDGSQSAEDIRSHIVLRFGQPPYPFLQPGDVPAHFMTVKGSRRKLTRDPAASEYNAMRVNTVNYQSLPKTPHFVDNQDKFVERHYWMQDVTLSAPRSVAEIRDALIEKIAAADDRVVKLLFALPIRTKRTEGYHVPVGGDSLDLYVRTSDTTAEFVTSVSVTKSEIRPGSSTGFVYVTF
jgi:hypothetical protein